MNELKLKRLDPFDPKAESYAILYHLARYRFAGRLLSKTDSVLDVGCGFGSGTRFLKDFCHQVTGIDIDRKAIIKAKSMYNDIENLRFFVCDVEDMEDCIVEWPEFNIMVAIDLIEHIENPERFVEDAYNLLPKNGIFICGTPRKQKLEPRNSWHNHEFCSDEFFALLEGYFPRVFRFGQNEEVVGVFNTNTAWYLWGIALRDDKIT